MIDRQKLLDKLWNRYMIYAFEEEELANEVCDIISIIKKQPEVNSSRREWYQIGYQDGLNADKWISIEDRKPEIGEEVIVDCGDIDIYLLNIIETQDGYGKLVWEDKYGYWHDFEEVELWQPKPEHRKQDNH